MKNSQGFALLNLNSFYRALQCFSQAIKLNPKHSDCIYQQRIYFINYYNDNINLQNLNKYLTLSYVSQQFFSIEKQRISLNHIVQFVNAVQCFDQIIKLNQIQMILLLITIKDSPQEIMIFYIQVTFIL